MRRYLLFFLFVMATWGYSQTSPFKLYQENYQTPIRIGEHDFVAEIVSTPTLMQKGMMHRPKIDADQAMLFVYQQPQAVSFWMKNMHIPLDMLFFDAHGVLQEIKSDVPPCVTFICPDYPAQHDDNQFVVEIKAGQAKALGINVGDTLYGY